MLYHCSYFSIMRLIVITPDETAKDELAVVNSLFESGLMRLHLRKPSFTSAGLSDYISGIPSIYHNRIVLCGCFELWREYRLAGIHLNSFQRSDRQVLDSVTGVPQATVSTSFHSWQEIMNNKTEYDYVFISPVFDSISKSGYKAGIDLSGAVSARQQLAARGGYIPEIIGLGGVGVDQVAVLRNSGFDGAAILGAVWMADDPVAAFKKILSATTAPQLP